VKCAPAPPLSLLKGRPGQTPNLPLNAGQGLPWHSPLTATSPGVRSALLFLSEFAFYLVYGTSSRTEDLP
jgi:hypothetical protein